MADLASLLSATGDDALHQALVLGVPACQERESSLALSLFRSAHSVDATGAVVTAMLLMTDTRWSAAARPVARAIEATAIVPDNEMDLLAHALVAADDSVYWACPCGWFDGPEIVIDIDRECRVDPDVETSSGDAATGGEVVVARSVAVGIRRWAASRLLRTDTTRWGPLYQLARSTGGARGGAIMLGVLDERALLPEHATDTIERAASTWTRREVRAAAGRRPIPMPDARANQTTSSSEASNGQHVLDPCDGAQAALF